MSTFTIRVSSSATNAAGTAYGQQPDQGAPSYFDMVVSGSTDPLIPNGVYDAFCLNPTVPITVASAYSADNYAGNSPTSYVPIGFSSLSQNQVDRINWLLSQNFTSDGKFAGQYNYGEVQVAIWKTLGFTDAQIAATNQNFLTDNTRNTIVAAEVDFLVSSAQSAVASGNGVLPADAFFTTIIDPAGTTQPLIVQLLNAKLGNFVWEDIDRDGVQDAGEAGVDRVVVELYDGNGNFIASTLTGDDFSTAAVEHGYYQFAGLKAGDYQVKFVAPTYDFTVRDSNAAGATDSNDSDADVLTGLSQTVTLAAGESNQTVDAGLVQKAPAPSAITGFVYCDDNNDGIKQGTEVGLGGVTVRLTGTNNLGQPVDLTTTTADDGSYSFNNLSPGTYAVTETTQPADKLDGKDTAGSTPGSVAGEETITNIVLGAGQTSSNNNFGEILPSRISGYVYEDFGNDGVRGAGEPAIGGVTVTLTGTNDLGQPVSVTTTTNASGFYEFVGLRPGTYSVTEAPQPGAYLDGKDTAGSAGGNTGVNDVISNIVLGAGANSTENNFGELVGAQIRGFVYCDDNNDGIKQGTEVGLGGVTVTLSGTNDLGQPVTASTTTANDGSYSFTGLRPGTYTVTEATQPADKLDGKDTAGFPGNGTAGNEVISNIVLTQGLISSDNNFGEILPAKLSGYVYEDVGDDGVRNNEAPIAGVTVTLTGTNDLGQPVSVTTTTNAAGFYEFTALRPGSYTVTETQPATYVDGKDTAGSTGGTVGNDVISGITLVSGANSTENNFGELPKAQINGFVYCDDNNDGIKQGTEVGLGGVTVTLSGTNDLGQPVTASTTTANDGSYSFTGLRPGTYTVTEATQPADKLDGKDTAGTPGGGTAGNEVISNIVLTPGLVSNGNNFGEILPAKLSGYVYEDVGNDGVRNNEAPIAGVTVTLTGTNDLGQPVSVTTTTNAAGFYEFTALRPGSYTVTETQPATYVDGKDTAGSTGGTVGNDVISGITLVSGANSTENNFGELPKAQINGFVYCDDNNDGIKQGTEVGLGGVTVTLSGTNDLGQPVTASTTTANDGSYSFTGLRPGTYTVTEATQPADKLDGKDTAGTPGGGTAGNEVISNIVLTPGLVSNGNNFGEILPAKLSGYVYEDVGNDGVRNNEAPIAGVTVTLTGTNDLGQPVSVTTTTNAAGFYEFVGLRPGTYSVTEAPQPGAYLDGKDTAGSAGGNTGVNDVISNIVLGAGANSTENNFGELVGAQIRGFVYCDDNNDGIKQGTEVGLGGVTVTLSGTNDLGQPVTASTTTANDGSYIFAGLRPGTYTVTEATQPADKLDGKDTAGFPGNGTAGNEVISNIVLTQGLISSNNNFGEIKPSALSGFVYEDLGNDGVKGAGEVGIANVSVRLTGTDDLGNVVTRTTTTNASGFYEFTNLRPGTYTVTETQPAGFTDGKDTLGSTGGTLGNDVLSNIVLGSGVSSVNNNFGELKPLQAKLGDFVWEDKNANGVQELGEAGIAGVTVQLLNSANVVVQTTTTDAAGKYGFNVDAGTYSVNVLTPNGYVVTTRDQGADAADSDIDATGRTGSYVVPAGGENLTVDAGFYKTAAIGDRVWLDCNGNGLQDAGELGVAGVTVKLLDANGGVVATQVTDSNGNYLFSTLKPGSYALEFGTLSGYSRTVANAGNNASDSSDSDADVATGRTAYTTLESGETDRTWDAGLAPVCRPVTFDFSGNTAVDGTDGNSRSYTDALTGVAVTARAFSQDKGTNTWQKAYLGAYGGGLGVTDSSEGDGSGNLHTIDNVGRNNYVVLQFSQDVKLDKAFLGYVVGDSDVQVWIGNSATTITSMSNSVLSSLGFSEVNTTTETAARWADLNAGGVTGNVIIIAADTTDTTPDDYFKLEQISICAPDFCAPVAKASIGDLIWYDKNANGLKDAGEAGVAGVTVELRSNGVDGVDGGAVLATTTTDANGKYLFSNLNPGDYHIDVVESTLPAGFVFTKSNQGANDAIDSDVRATAAQPLNWGIMANTTLSAGENDLSWDAGVYKVGVDVEKYVSGTVTTTSNNGGSEGTNCGDWLAKCFTSSSWQWVSSGWWGGSWQEIKTPTGWSGISGCTGKESFNQIFGCNITGGSKSIYDVLCSTGSSSAEKMMRESVAAYLNACHDKVDYAYSKEQVVAHTKWGVETGRYDECSKSYEQENNKGCDWGTIKTNWNCVVAADLYDADAPPGLEVKTGSTVTFTYIVKNTGDTALKDVVLTDDRIASVTYVSGDTDKDGLLDTNETWTYTAKEVASAGTIKNTGTVTAVDAAGGVATVTDKDDAYYTGSGALKASLGDRVWEDKNGNGVQDTGEAGLSGVKVVLSGAGKDGIFGNTDDVTHTTTTNANGLYKFSNLDAGKYVVSFQAGAGYLFTKTDLGGNDAKDSDVNSAGKTGVITLDAGEHDVTVDAGLFRKACVGDKVFQDANHNSVQDAGEAGIGGITVKLLDAAGVVVGTDVTDSYGKYLFSELDPGAYTLQFDKTNVSFAGANMSNWKWAVKDKGTNDAIDSDVKGDGVATTNVTLTSQFTLDSGESDMTRDAGITPIVIDLNGNGIHTVARADAQGSFDLFGNGKAVVSGWLSGDDGFLAVDANGNGKIDGINELFGGNSKGDGFAKLASFDSNGDGLVNDLDSAFGQLLIWRDANGNHSTDAGELMSLADAGVASLTTGYTELPQLDAQGNLHLERSTATLADGQSVAMTDVYFNVSADDAAAAGVTLPTMADLLGHDSTLDSLLGASPQALGGLAEAGDAAASHGGGDAAEALRRLAALSREAVHAQAA